MKLADIVYTLVENRLDKYSTYEKDKVISSTIYYCKTLNVPFNIQEIESLLSCYAKNIEFCKLDLSTYHSKPTNKFELPSNACVRFAACPNLSPTLLNLKGLAIHKLLQIQNKSLRVYMRFDDTNPDKKRASFQTYNSYIKAINWLGLDVTYVYVSDRLKRYYEVAKDLIVAKKAYLEYPNKKISYDLDEYDKFIKSKKKYTKCVLRIDDEHKWIALRYVSRPHVRVKTSRVWPTYNFHSPIDECDLGITHIFRGKDLYSSHKYQKSILEFLNYTDIQYTYWGRNRFMTYAVHSSTIMKDKTVYDPAALVYENLVYYNIQPEAILGFYKEIGLSNTDTILNIGLLKKYQKKIKCFKYAPEPFFIKHYVEHISLKEGYITIDKTYYSFKKDTVFEHSGNYYKINKLNKLIRLVM